MKEIVIGITGGIAAYKVIDIISYLKKQSIGITCVVTEAALKFITELTLETISGAKVISDLFPEERLNIEVEHIALADKAELIIIAPATANCIAKLTVGLADDFLTTLVLATKAKILVVPSMNENMLLNKITQENINKLKERGFEFIDPVSGHLACGKIGEGRFPENEVIIKRVIELLK